MMLLAAIDALKAGGGQPAVNVKVILDSEEEKARRPSARSCRRTASCCAATPS